jgi:hypothetical protein
MTLGISQHRPIPGASFYLSMDSGRQLGIHATMTGQDKSQIVDGLIQAHLRDWVVQYRPTAKGTEEMSSEPEAVG